MTVPAVVALAAAGCGSATPGHGQSIGSGPATSSAAPRDSSSTGSGSAHDAGSLAALLRAGLSSVRSLHIALTTVATSATVTASGDEQLRNGKLTALDLSETVSAAGQFRLIYVGGRTYAKLPANLNHSTKPYTLVTTSSSNPVIRQLATTLGATLGSGSVDSYGLLAQAARSVHNDGTTLVGGVPATHYSFVVDVTRLPATFPNRAAIEASGLTSLPVELWVDAHGRPIKVTEKFTVAGQHVSVQLAATRYDVPVHIVAPPASQVGPG